MQEENTKPKKSITKSIFTKTFLALISLGVLVFVLTQFDLGLNFGLHFNWKNKTDGGLVGLKTLAATENIKLGDKTVISSDGDGLEFANSDQWTSLTFSVGGTERIVIDEQGNISLLPDQSLFITSADGFSVSFFGDQTELNTKDDSVIGAINELNQNTENIINEILTYPEEVGDVTGVEAGDGLQGGGTEGVVSLSVDPTVLRTTSLFGGDLTGIYSALNLKADVIGDTEIDYSDITLSDFTNDANYYQTTLDSYLYNNGDTSTGTLTINDNDGVSGDVNLILGDADETGNITIGGITLSSAGIDNLTSGANLIGVFDEFTNSNATILQAVLNDFDNSITAASGQFVQFRPVTSQLSGDTADSLIWFNEDGSGTPNLIETEVGGVDIFVVNNSGILTLSGISAGIVAPRVNKVVVVDGNTFPQSCLGINQAIDALGVNGGEVYLPEATYTCAETITIDANNTTIRGAGYNTIINASADQNFGNILNTGIGRNNLILRDFKIIGRKAGTGGHCIYGSGPDFITLDNLYIQNCDSSGLYFDGVTMNHTITNSYITGADDIGLFIRGGSHTISNNIITANATQGIYLDETDDTLIEGNTISSNSNNGIFFDSPVTQMIVNGNFIYNNGGYGINSQNTTDESIMLSDNNIYSNITRQVNLLGNNHTISNNRIRSDSSTYGIYVDGANINITLNTISDSLTGLIINGTNHHVSENIFTNNTTNITNNSTTSSIINSNNGNTSFGLTTAAVERMEVNGAIKIGTTTGTNAGTVRWTGSDFEGYNGSVWESLTAGNSNEFVNFAPASAQLSGNTTNSLIWINEDGIGTPNLIELEVGGNDVFVLSNTGALTLTGVNSSITAPRVNKVVVVDGVNFSQTCDGINAAITALGVNGGEIYLPQGTYTCDETVLVAADNTIIRGAGWGTIIQPVAWGSWGLPGNIIDLNIHIQI